MKAKNFLEISKIIYNKYFVSIFTIKLANHKEVAVQRNSVRSVKENYKSCYATLAESPNKDQELEMSRIGLLSESHRRNVKFLK